MALAQNSLAKEGIETTVVSGAPTALLVLSSPQKVNQSEAYRNGLIEIQDVASQMAGDLVSIDKNDKVLDLCAGAGGKALALAARLDAKIFIHDISEKRLAETESRAKRAGVQFTKCAPEAYRAFAPFDHVVVDAPCSGSGTWRRGPDSKWQFNFDILETYRETQVELLDQAASISGKSITYMTCSVFLEENEYQIAAFEQRHPNWRCLNQKFFVPTDQNDGLFCAVLRLTN
ncbi:MAG: methyltransferase domain-containing protein [Pseudomonadota bacterium]